MIKNRLFSKVRSGRFILASSLLLFSITAKAQFPAPYCGPLTFTNGVEPITLVNFAGISNTSVATTGGPAHQDFISVIGTVYQGLSNTIILKGNTDGDYTSYCRVYVDWNQDNDFVDAGESYDIGTITNSTGTDAIQLTGSIAVPAAATIGNTRMRVVKRYGSYPTGPCQTGSGYGQAEDYTLTVAVPSCSPPVATFTVVPDCVNNQYSVSVDVSSLGTATSVAIKEGATTFVTATATGIFTAGPFNAGTNHTLTLEHNVDAICNVNSPVQSYQCPAVNDECANAIELIPAATCTSISGNTFGATENGNVPTCADANEGDVWYSFVATSSDVSVTLDNVVASTATYYYFGVTAYSGDCGSLSELECGYGYEEFGLEPAEITLNGLTVGSTYYLQVWEEGFYDGNFDPVSDDMVFDICVKELPPAPSCVTNIAPANATVNLDIYPLAPSFSWNAVSGATGYQVYLGASAASATSIGTVTDTSATINGLAFSSTYFWYIVPVNNSGNASGCVTNATSFTTEPAPPVPANDNCANAASLTVTSGFAINAIVGTTASATSEGTAAPTCQASVQPGDVWYSAVVPASGSLIVQTSAMNTSVTDMVLVAYSGTCGSLTAVACDDDSNPESGPSSTHSRISLTGQVAGSILYFRVLSYGITSTVNVGEFAISAWDPSVLPPVSPGGNCVSAPVVNINATNGNLYRWVPIMDASGNIIAELYPNGNALGNVNTSVFVNSGPVRQSNGVFYLDRNVTLTPETQPTSSVKVRTYILNTELSALQAADASVTSLSGLNFSKNNDVCQSAVAGATGQFTQSYSTTYGTLGSLAEFNTPSFSSIYLRGGSTPLPVILKSFTGKNDGAVNHLSWTTTAEQNFSYFELLRSQDGSHFEVLANINSNRNEYGSTYEYKDTKAEQGKNFYRLKIVDQDGRSAMSDIVELSVKSSSSISVSVHPNPVKQQLNVAIKGNIDGKGTIVLIDVLGKVVSTIALTSNYIVVDMNKLPSGIYIVKYTDNSNTSILKVTKE